MEPLIIIILIVFIFGYIKFIEAFESLFKEEKNDDWKRLDWDKVDAMIAEWKYWRTHNYTFPLEPKKDNVEHSILFTDKCPEGLSFHRSTKIFLNEYYEDYPFKTHSTY